MRKSKLVAATLAVAAVLTWAPAGAAAPRADSGQQLSLPAPTGPHPVGSTNLHLIDHSRPDPWGSGAERELMVTVYYPAKTTRGYERAAQFTPGAAAAFDEIDTELHPELPSGQVDWAATKTDAYVDAPARAGARPVLLYAPGLADPRTIGTGVAQDLASRGYVVVAVDHTGEASEVEFPGGRVSTIAMPMTPEEAARSVRTAVAARVADNAFVLDELEALAAGRNPDVDGRELPDGLGRALGLDLVGAYGHSAGGAVAVESMYEDRRIDSAVNLDGNLNYYPEGDEPGELFPVAQHGVDRPVLLLGSELGRDADIDRSWSALLSQQAAPTRRLQLARAAHHVFTDYAGQGPQLAAAGLMSPADRDALVGPIAPAESVPAVRDYVASFFDKELRGTDDGLLDGPSERYPDMKFLN